MAKKNLFAATKTNRRVGAKTTIARLRAEGGDGNSALYKTRSQTVFGECTEEDANIVMVGEGGRPGGFARKQTFVGPAGRLSDARRREAGVRSLGPVYAPHAVKHFSSERTRQETHSQNSTGGRRSRRAKGWIDMSRGC